MDAETVVAQVRALAEPFLAEQAVELVELAYRREGRGMVLRLLVHTPGGITLDRCADLNRALSDRLDAGALLDEPYVLEVASPGLDRPLATRRDFERVAGETITADLREPFAGQRQLIGRVVSADDASVTLETKRWGSVALPLAHIAHAVVKLQW